MSWHNIVIFITISIFIVGCGGASGPKAKFAHEDFFVMNAVDSFEHGDYNASATYYKHLYKKTEKEEYLDSFFNSLLLWEKYNFLEKHSREFIKEKPKQIIPRRYLVLALYNLNETDEAISAGETVIEMAKKKQARDYIVLADLYLKKENYEQSLLYFQSGYSIVPDRVIVDKIAYLLFEKLDQQKEAVAYLESHLRIHGYDLYLSKRLSDYYLKMGDVGSIINVYKRIYKKSDDSLIAGKIVELYLLRKNYKGLIAFLEETGINNKMLFEVYKLRKDYKNAAKVSLKVYKETMDVKYLAQNAMITFEANKTKDKKLIEDTIKKLEEVVESNDNPIYLNYLGYLLIDHDLDVTRGLSLVKRALEKDKNNLYYIDSLAWGEFKLKRYQKAYNLMKSVHNSLGEDPTVKEHFETIKKVCQKEKGCRAH